MALENNRESAWNADRWSGVSSSGSGVAVAAGLCFASIGTDTGGSIRYPSAANGCVGLKPTYGRISRYGVLALAESLDHVGPMCRTVEARAFHAPTFPSRRADYGPGFLDVLDYGSSLSGVQYAKANTIRLEVAGQVNNLLQGVDCMVCPSMSNAAGPKLENPYIPETAESWAQNVANDIHTKPFNFAGVPTLSVPCGFSSYGMPFSVQFVGRPLSEAVICRVGHAYQRSTDWDLRHPDL